MNKYKSIERQYFVWGLRIDRILSGISRGLYTYTGPDFIELMHKNSEFDSYTGRLKALETFRSDSESTDVYKLEEYLNNNKGGLIARVRELEESGVSIWQEVEPPGWVNQYDKTKWQERGLEEDSSVVEVYVGEGVADYDIS